MSKVWMPNFTMTLVRRASADLPYNNFIFRVDPKITKTEIKEYLQKIYKLNVVRVGTINYLGETRRAGRKIYKMKDYKKVYVRVSDDPIPAPRTKPLPPNYVWGRAKRVRRRAQAEERAAKEEAARRQPRAAVDTPLDVDWRSVSYTK